MYKKFTLYLIVLSLSAVLFSSCAQPFLNNQLQFGITAAKRELWDEAIFRWKKVLLSDPTSSAAHNNIAVAYEKKGLWDEAKKEYEIALKLNPRNKYIESNYTKFKEVFESLKKEKKDEKK